MSERDHGLAGDETWTDRMDRVGRSVWEFFHSLPEVDYVRVEFRPDARDEVEILATDVDGGVVWVDERDAANNRQVIRSDGSFARDAARLAEKRRAQP